ncbi:hypothetical protein JCM15519_21620 [Fundidesulfovibrio butyratiphilus]
MHMLKEKFPEYAFDFDCEFYIRVQARSKAVEAQTTQEKLEEIYRCFFMNGSGEKRVGYVYLNYYDSSGEFQYQITYLQDKKIFHKSLQDFY